MEGENSMKKRSEFEKYRVVQNRLYESDFDRFMALENEVNCLQKKSGGRA